jgi:DNA-binding transcriptional ArsR family regulator
MTSLTTQPAGLSFSDLRTLCALSDGNLNRHLAVLQEAGFVQIDKEGRGRNSRSLCRVTRTGRAAFLQYLTELERVLADAAPGSNEAVFKNARGLRTEWST